MEINDRHAKWPEGTGKNNSVERNKMEVDRGPENMLKPRNDQQKQSVQLELEEDQERQRTELELEDQDHTILMKKQELYERMLQLGDYEAADESA